MAAKYTTTPIAYRAIRTMPTTWSKRSCCGSEVVSRNTNRVPSKAGCGGSPVMPSSTRFDRRRRRPSSPFPDDYDQVLGGFSSPSPEEVLADLRLDDDIQKALSDLPYEFREAVVMCDVIGLSYEEISQAVAIPVGTVRSRIHRGRRLLRERLI